MTFKVGDLFRLKRNVADFYSKLSYFEFLDNNPNKKCNKKEIEKFYKNTIFKVLKNLNNIIIIPEYISTKFIFNNPYGIIFFVTEIEKVKNKNGKKENNLINKLSEEI